jgi:ribonuclease P protein component
MIRPSGARPRQGVRLGPGDRLRLGAEYRRVYDAGRSLHGRHLVLFVLLDDTLVRRAGFVAGRKVGDAVRRNRARRRLRESFRRLKPGMAHSGAWMVFVAKKPCATESQATIEREMSELLTRAGLLAPPESSSTTPSSA